MKLRSVANLLMWEIQLWRVLVVYKDSNDFEVVVDVVLVLVLVVVAAVAAFTALLRCILRWCYTGAVAAFNALHSVPKKSSSGLI